MDFAQLIQPDTFTIELAIFTIGIIITIAYIGVKMRHPVVLFFWAITVSTFFLAILIDLDFMIFWVSAMLSVIVISLAGTVRYALAR